MKPNAAKFYHCKLNLVAMDLVELIKTQNGVVKNFLTYSRKFAFEAITLVATNQRVGLLNKTPNRSALHAMAALDKSLNLYPKIYSSFPIWNYLPWPRLSPLFCQLEDGIREVTSYVHGLVNFALREIQSKPPSQLDDDTSVLEKVQTLSS